MYKEFHDMLYKSMTDVDINYDKTWFWDNEEIPLFTKDIEKTIDFVKNECSDQEFVFLGEIFQEIVEKTKNKEFVDTIKARFKQIKPDVDITGTESDIECAEAELDQ